MAAKRIAGVRSAVQARFPVPRTPRFDITVYAIREQELPAGLLLAVEEAIANLPARAKRGRRPNVDEALVLWLLAEALWCAAEDGRVIRTNRLLAEDMTRRYRSRCGPLAARITGRQLRQWLTFSDGRCGERRAAAIEAVRGLLVRYRRRVDRQTWKGRRLGPAEFTLRSVDTEPCASGRSHDRGR